MKKLLPLLVFSLSFFYVDAQPSRVKTDSVARLVQQYFNEKSAAKLYALAGETFRNAITEEQFKAISENNLFPLGTFQESQFEKMGPGGVSKYKAVFTNATLAMYISLDEKEKLSTFLFNAYIDESARKTGAVATSNPKATAMDKAVDDAVQPYMQLATTSGLSIGILKDGKTQFYGYGETVKGNGKLPDENTVFEIGSITKTFTSTLLAIAVQEGKVKLSDPVSKYLGHANNLQSEGVAITLAMLSNHTSGLPRMPSNFKPEDPSNPYLDYDKQKLRECIQTISLKNKPGTAYDYSNLGMALLGYVLDTLYGKDFELLVQKITQPLQLTRTAVNINSFENKTQGYNETGSATPGWDFKIFAAAGALRSSAKDMLRYATASLGQAPAALKEAMQLTHKTSFEQDRNRMGLGWHWIRVSDKDWLFHNGGTGGYRSFLAIQPEKKMALTVLSNAAVDPDDFCLQILEWLEKN